MPMTSMLIKLNGLTTDNLQAIQTHISAVLAGRLDTRCVPGRNAVFIDRDNTELLVRIDKINQKTASCTEIEPTAGKKWRIYMTALKVVPVERKVAHRAPMPIIPHKPSSIIGDAW